MTAWRNSAKSRREETNAGQEPVKMCSICDVKVHDCDRHSRSEEHPGQVRKINWFAFDKLKNELNSQLSEENL
jgi:hypothetical protein